MAATTPGICRIRSKTDCATCATPADVRYCGVDSDVRIVSTFLAWKPGSTLPSANDVRISRAAPTSNTTARLTSTSTSTERVLFWRKPLPERPLESLMTVFRSAREAMSAGIKPNSKPVNIDSARPNSATRQSMPSNEPVAPSRGNPAVFTVSSRRMPT